MAYTWNNDVVQSNLVKANELLEIRDKINLERTRRGIGTTIFSQPLVVGNVINYAAVDEIRNRVIGIKACSLPAIGDLMTSSLVNSFKNQLDVFNNTPGTPVYGWVEGPWEYVYNTRSHQMTSGFLPHIYCFYPDNAANSFALTNYDGQHLGYNFLYRRISSDTTIDYNTIYLRGVERYYHYNEDEKWGGAVWQYDIKKCVYDITHYIW